MKLSSSEREGIVLQSKTGIVEEPWGYDQSYEHIVASVDESLKSLNTDYLDVLLLHRPDALVEPEEVVRAFGVSNHTPRQIDLLKTAVKQPLLVNQVQFSITHSSLVAQGMTSNMTTSDDAFTRDGGGLVDYARVNKITLKAWSPIQIGYEPGIFLGSLDYPELKAEIEGAAANRNSR